MLWQGRWGYIAGRGALDGAVGGGAVAPVNTVLPVISGTTIVGSTLSTTNGTWTGSPTPTYTYQWKRGGVNIGGATANTYLLVTADLAATITVEVTATNAAGSASSTSTGVGPILSYATWDAATVTSVTLSGGNLVATNTGTTSANQGAHVASANGKTSGKYYFEVTCTTVSSGTGSNLGVAIGTTAATYTNLGGNGTAGVNGYPMSGSVYGNGTKVSAIALVPFTNGQIMGVAVDLDNRKAWFRKSPAGSWNSGLAGADPATNVNGVTIVAGTIIPFLTFGGSGGTASNVMTANFGASAFSGTVPSGFTSGWPV